MALPTFSGFSLQDSTYLTKNIQFRSMAPRNIETAIIARRLGARFVNQQVGYKVITLSGIILGTTAAGLQTAVDNLHKALNEKEGSLEIDSGRVYTATRKTVNIPELNYTQTTALFEIEFICATPYSRGPATTAGFTVTSGTNTQTVTTTISGSVENRPTLTLTMPPGTGDSLITDIEIQNTYTGNTITISGTYGYSNAVVFDYDNFNITNDGTTQDYIGQFDSFNPGSNSLTITVSGQNDGVTGLLSYRPRYW